MRLLFKDAILKIKKSISRYISIVFIITLGVAIFVGLMVSSPMMLNTASNYIAEGDIYDAKIVSTLGISDKNIAYLENLSMLEEVLPSYSIDAINDDKVYKVHSLEERNKPILVEGRMPEKENECLASYLENDLGDKISLTATDLEDNLKVTEYEVVGLVKTPMYMHKTYGSSSIGNGSIYSYIFVDKNNFTMDYYTEVYLYLNTSNDTFSSEYANDIKKLEAQIAAIKEDNEVLRYEEVYKEINDEILEAEAELATESADAKKELDDALAELEDGEKELAEAIDKYEAAKELIAMSYSMIDRNLREAAMAYNNGISQVDSAVKQMSQQMGGMVSEDVLKNTSITILENAIENNQSIPQDKKGELIAQLAPFEAYGSIGAFQDSLRGQKEYLLSTKNELYAEVKKREESLVDASIEIEDAKKELADGWEEYYDGLAEYEEKIADARKEIDDAKEDLADLKMTKWITETRLDNDAINRFSSDANKVAAIGAVFPSFFILVVALVVSNSLTRLVEEERGLAGTYLSLGYSNKDIVLSYIIYIMIANVIGVVVGSLAAYLIISPIIYNIYHSMYLTPDLLVDIDWGLILIVFFVFLGLVSFVTYRVVRKELKEKPSELLRPKAPKAGKRILLERIGFIWHHTSFIWKVTFRNLFRYKKRVLMTVLGVAGCTALLLVGFGLQDGINGLVKVQYHDIIASDGFIILKDEVSEEDSEINELLKSLGITDIVYTRNEQVKIGEEDAFLVVYDDLASYDKMYHLIAYDTREKITTPEVVINQKLAHNNGLKTSGELVMTIDDVEYPLSFSETNMQYLLHYIHMPKEIYQETIDSDFKYNTINFKVDSNVDIDALSKEILSHDEFLGVSLTKDMVNILNEVVNGINTIVYLIIVFALLLAFTVLYNLTIINVNERVREIATLKVLGFKPKEVNSYIFREIAILASIGIVVGLFIGIFMENFVIRVAESSDMMFIREIEGTSFIYSAIITFMFTIFIQFVTKFKLDKIDMIESLKSIE